MFRSSWQKRDYDKRARRQAQSSGRYIFTLHADYKMRQYHLSRQRVTRVIRSPYRTEEGIVEDTIAVMQPASTKTAAGKPTWTQEIWVMYKLDRRSTMEGRRQRENSQISNLKLLTSTNQKIRIISCWRYPGISPERDPIPEHILREIADGIRMEIEGG